MPYIKKEMRLQLAFDIPRLPSTAGELNYLITAVCKNCLKQWGESYQTYNDIIGALEGAKLELYRRKIAAYEDKKIKENGDVY